MLDDLAESSVFSLIYAPCVIFCLLPDYARGLVSLKVTVLCYSMSRHDVANLMVRLGEYEIKTQGETQLFESKAARVVRHKEFSQQTLVNLTGQ